MRRTPGGRELEEILPGTSKLDDIGKSET